MKEECSNSVVDPLGSAIPVGRLKYKHPNILQCSVTLLNIPSFKGIIPLLERCCIAECDEVVICTLVMPGTIRSKMMTLKG